MLQKTIKCLIPLAIILDDDDNDGDYDGDDDRDHDGDFLERGKNFGGGLLDYTLVSDGI